MSGPAPDPNALRRDRPKDQAGWTSLPAEGRPGEAPEWPLITAADREWELWADLWERPQAVIWERLGQELEVALFVRQLAQAEQQDKPLELQKIVRQYLDSLGLSVQGMLRNRWRIASPIEALEEEAPSSPPAARRPGPRDRLKVVPNGEGA